MNHRLVEFSEASSTAWDGWVATIPHATYLHSASFLRFLHEMVPAGSARTFAVLDENGKPLALCPFAVSPIVVAGQSIVEGSWNGAPLGYPAIADRPPTFRRRLVRLVFDILHELAAEAGLGRILFRLYPISRKVMEGDGSPIQQMEALAHGYACLPQNTIIMDLRPSTENLEANMARYHRRRIHQSERQGLQVRSYHGESRDARESFQAYQTAHFAAAGRLTRSQSTFDQMLSALLAMKASLFVAYLGEKPISFLFCGEFERMAFGWSQANVDGYESEYSPRHLLEWETIRQYQRRGFLYYEVGTRWYGPQLYKCPSQKEIGISEFKERYGGHLWPDIWFERFFNRDLFETEMRVREARFLESDYFNSAKASVEIDT